MGYIGKVKLDEIDPNHPFASTQITFGAKKPESPKQKAKDGLAATISVSWGYELHSLTLTPDQWWKVRSGDPLGLEGEGYYYEGEFFQDYWIFSGGLDGELVVNYGNDGGTGWQGSLHSATIEESLLEGTNDV